MGREGSALTPGSGTWPGTVTVSKSWMHERLHGRPSCLEPIRIERLDEVDRAGVEPPHDLDVLLRHRLLPQPGGFEGITAVGVCTEASDQPTMELGDPRRRCVDGDT